MAEITMDDILMIEAHAQALLDHAKKMRAKLEATQRPSKRKERDAVVMARVRAHLNKTMLRGRARLEANKKAGL